MGCLELVRLKTLVRHLPTSHHRMHLRRHSFVVHKLIVDRVVYVIMKADLGLMRLDGLSYKLVLRARRLILNLLFFGLRLLMGRAGIRKVGDAQRVSSRLSMERI